MILIALSPHVNFFLLNVIFNFYPFIFNTGHYPSSQAGRPLVSLHKAGIVTAFYVNYGKWFGRRLYRSVLKGYRGVLAHPEPFAMGHTQHFAAMGAEVNIPLTQNAPELAHPYAAQFSRAMRAYRLDVFFGFQSYHRDRLLHERGWM